MSRETRWNLVFLAAFLAFSLPGAVILFKKKLDPQAKPMYLPDPVRQTLAFNDPQGPPPGVGQRVVPPKLRSWLLTLAAPTGMADSDAQQTYLDDDRLLVSPDRQVQLLAGSMESGGRLVVVLLTWPAGERGPVPGLPSVTVTNAEGQPTTLAVRHWQEWTIPEEVRAELRSFGYIRPPHKVGRAELEGQGIGRLPFFRAVVAEGSGRQVHLEASHRSEI